MADVFALCAAGAIAWFHRAGHLPLEEDDPIEIHFANGRVFTIEIGAVGATDVQILEGALLDVAFGHLRTEEPDTFAAIAAEWTREEMPLDWAVGESFSNPRRLWMTNPYRVEVGYAFDVGGRVLALFGEADLIFVAPLDDADIEGYGLEIAPYSAA